MVMFENMDIKNEKLNKIAKDDAIFFSFLLFLALLIVAIGILDWYGTIIAFILTLAFYPFILKISIKNAKTREGKLNKKIETENQIKEKTDSNNLGYNKLAIIGLILSVVSIFGVGLAGLIGFVLGIIALNQIKHTYKKGKGLAIAAIIIGFIWSFGVGILKRLIEAGF